MAFTQPRARSPASGHAHPDQSASTYLETRSPDSERVHLRAHAPAAAASHRRRRRRPGDVVPQGPAARQHRSRGPPGRRRRHANPHPGRRAPSTQPPTTSTTRHARHQAEDPQPNHPEKHNQDTPPTVTGPTTSTTRSHDEQVPFSRAISTVLTANKYRSHGRAGSGPYQPPPVRSRTVPELTGRGRVQPCPYQEEPDGQASPRPAAPGPSAARRRPGATARPPRTAPPPPPAAAGGRRPARRSRPSTRAPRGG